MAVKQIHNAIVTRNIDDDLGTSLRGAVYFNAPTLFDGEYPFPAVPCFPFASDLGAGFFFVPKVGDEIEVEITVDDGGFDTSDVEFPEPRWRCMVYSDAADIADLFKENYPFRMGWMSNSGHYLLFDDAEGFEKVRLQHTFGSFLEFDEAGNWLENSKRDYDQRIAGNRSASIVKDDNLFINKNRFVQVSKDETSIVRGNFTKEIGGDFNLSIRGRYNFAINDMAENFGSKAQTITGSKVVTVDGGSKEIVGGSKSESIVSNKATTISGNESKVVAGTCEETYGTGYKKTIVAGVDELEIVAGNYLINVLAGNLSISTVAGSAEIGNAVAALSIDPAGAITLSNPIASLSMDVAGNVQVGNAVGSVAIDPAGIVTVLGTQIVLGAQVGNVLTTVTAPVVDTITGAPHVGVPTLFAG